MFEILGEFLLGIIAWIFAEIIFYRFCYFTGMVLIRLLPFRKYYPGDVTKNNLSLIGMTFWLTGLFVAIIFLIFSAS
ncbi:MAG: hypothetical protein ACFCUV_23040 [Rivularia sp. (in: cyanobacteria)]